MSNACTPILVGVVGDKISFSNLAKFPFQTMGYKFMAVKKLSGIDSAQKNHASLY